VNWLKRMSRVSQRRGYRASAVNASMNSRGVSALSNLGYPQAQAVAAVAAAARSAGEGAGTAQLIKLGLKSDLEYRLTKAKADELAGRTNIEAQRVSNFAESISAQLAAQTVHSGKVKAAWDLKKPAKAVVPEKKAG